ncbi:MAG: SRPBCC family protein [Saprospiraceae bacterium]|nr:SRPBCC family protein [Saprospiraceae bacterium]MCB0542013.1 SRPBCC family protein [Saprospiraceae bacterium]MCB0574527.1 SRPBCC family protein [Saprospiraceae bacterium]MCB9305216.1 SRPBCC family protein [Lewinellaceae bacterium]MCB9354361.1 SRPBCC family protein [Lewinellaceae bacterium]
MKALKYILFTILGLLAFWMILGLFARHDYRIERTAEIDAPIAIVHEQVANFKNFKNWSPWHVYDPNMNTTIEGTDGAPGAKYSWSGNEKVGKGWQVLKAVTPDRVDFEVQYNEWSTSPASFKLEEIGDRTKVTWTLDMHVPFPWNAFAMLTDVNAFVGKDFDNGLINLGLVCEAIAHKKYRGYEVMEEDIPERRFIGIRRVVGFEDISGFFADNLPGIMEYFQGENLTPAGPPVGLFWSYDEEAGNSDMAAAIPVEEEKVPDGALEVFTVGGKKALAIDYYGDYAKTAEAHFAMDDCMADMKVRNIPPVIEEYVTDPAAEPDTAKWHTRIIYFIEPVIDSLEIENAPK